MSESGHAAIGLVMGQRHDSGALPEWVRIDFQRHGESSTAVVLRSSGRVEFSPTGSTRWHTRKGTKLVADVITDAEPVIDE